MTVGGGPGIHSLSVNTDKITEVTDKSAKLTDKSPKAADKNPKPTDKSLKPTDKSLIPTMTMNPNPVQSLKLPLYYPFFAP
ncbi:hypothetical protein [Halobacillus trueperi]|uniref:hypothetical protein n=1 Tax=Halobacillus trueperi TaxID=156205 RepID=UPI003736F30D